MMRSLFSGVSGLKTHQTKMDVIGNNIANVNTVAYKASNIVFGDLISQTTQNASGPNATTGTGGVNARQIGLGVKSGAININITGQGSAQSTGNPFDIMIEGDNFFVVSNGSENLFTRDGSFYVDAGGNLAMTSNGYNVMGWQVDEETGYIRKETVTALRIMNSANMTYPPEATTMGYMGGIIDKHDTDVTSANGKVVNLKFYDALGYSYTAKFVFRQSDNVNQYSLELDKIIDSTGAPVDINPNAALAAANPTAALFGDKNTIQYKQEKITFDSTNYKWDGKQLKRDDEVVADLNDIVENGALLASNTVLDENTGETVQDQLDAIAKAYGYEGSTDAFLKRVCTLSDETTAAHDVTVERMLVNLAEGDPDALPTFTDAQEGDDTSFISSGRRFDGVTVHYDPAKGYFKGINGQETVTTVTLKLSTLGIGEGNFEDIVIDFSETTQFDNKGTSTIGATNGDEEGRGTGRRLGSMIGLSVQTNGMIYASYDNGMTKCLGQIATASFANASGLEKQGDNLYAATLNSGQFDGIGVDITANGGKMSSGQLEMSNVDLSSEFTEMITTQRGFQANSRIITVSDTLLEELTNLKR